MTSLVPSLSAYQEMVLGDVRAGLERWPKELPPKYFYDLRGSELFEEITRLPEYYLTRAERRLLSSWMPSRPRAVSSDQAPVIPPLQQPGPTTLRDPVELSRDTRQICELHRDMVAPRRSTRGNR